MYLFPLTTSNNISLSNFSKADQTVYVYVLFYPIFRKAMPFFIRVLQTVAFGNWYHYKVHVQSLIHVHSLLGC